MLVNNKTKNLLNLCIALILGVLVCFVMRNSTLSPEGQRLLGLLVTIMYIWMTGCVSLPVSCLILIVLGTFAMTDYTGVAKGGLPMSKALTEMLREFGNSTAITVFSGTALAAVVKSTGLAERIVFLVMKLVAGKSGKVKASKVLAAMFAADVPASVMIPAATGRCALYMSIAEGFEKPYKFGSVDGEHNPFQKAVWIAAGLIPIIMGGAFLTGAGTTVMVAGMIKQNLGVNQGWGGTFAILWLPAILLMIASWFLLIKLFPSNVDGVEVSFIDAKLKELGKMSYKEKYCIFSLILMVALFLTDSFHPIPAECTLLITLVLLFLPSVGVGNWKVEGKKISWDSYFVIAVALSFSAALTKFKVMDFFSDKIQLLGITSFFVALLLMIVITLVVRFGIASIASSTALLVPISMTVGNAAGLPVGEIVALVWVTYIFCRMSIFLPHQGAQLMMTFGKGFYAKNDLFKAGAVITAAAAIIYILWAYIAIPNIVLFI